MHTHCFLQNILCKTSFPKQLDIVDISESGLTATVRAVSIGIGKVKLSPILMYDYTCVNECILAILQQFLKKEVSLSLAFF